MTELTRTERRIAVAMCSLFGMLVALPNAIVVGGLVALAGAPTWGWFAAGIIVLNVVADRWSAEQMRREGLR